MNKELHDVLFECVKKYLWAEGGDGDVVIVCKGYKVLAKEFEEYQRTKVSEGELSSFKKTTDKDGRIIYCDNQEAIWFLDSKDRWTTNWSPMIIVELPYN